MAHSGVTKSSRDLPAHALIKEAALKGRQPEKPTKMLRQVHPVEGISNVTRRSIENVPLGNLGAAPSRRCRESGRVGLGKVVVGPPVPRISRLTTPVTNEENTNSMFEPSWDKLKHSGFKKAAAKSTHMYRRTQKHWIVTADNISFGKQL